MKVTHPAATLGIVGGSVLSTLLAANIAPARVLASGGCSTSGNHSVCAFDGRQYNGICDGSGYAGGRVYCECKVYSSSGYYHQSTNGCGFPIIS